MKVILTNNQEQKTIDYSSLVKEERKTMEVNGFVFLLSEDKTTIVRVKRESTEYVDSLIIPEGIKTIGKSAFFYCNNFGEVVLPKSCTSIDDCAFSSSSLSSIDLSNVLTIGRAAFSNCKRLEQVVFSKHLSTIPIKCFSYSALEYFKIPESVRVIEQEAFNSCQLKYICIPKNTKIKKKAFCGCNLLESVLFDGKTIVPDECFCRCQTLSRVNFNNVTSIGHDGFSFTEVDPKIISKDMFVDKRTFADCPNIKYLDIGNLSNICEHAFENCTQLEEVTIVTDGAKYVPAYLFSGCVNLLKVDIIDNTETLVSIGDEAFRKTNIIDIIIPDNVKRIGSNAFADSRLQYIKLPENSIKIDTGCFRNCRLEQISLSKVKIGMNAFRDCKQLTTVSVDNCSLSTGVFQNCKDLRRVSLCDTNIIPMDTFNGCKELKNIDLSGVKVICSYAFANTGLTSITIPKSVEAIHDHAFLKCNDVRKINLSGCNLDIDIEDSGFKYMDMCCEEFICPENFAKKLHYFFA